jgi:hypothetical protein
MKHALLKAVAVCATIWPCQAWCCGGPAGNYVAISFDGQKYTVTDIGRRPVHVTFTAWSMTLDLQLAPGQSGSPYSAGVFRQSMSGYQSCYAS